MSKAGVFNYLPTLNSLKLSERDAVAEQSNGQGAPDCFPGWDQE